MVPDCNSYKFINLLSFNNLTAMKSILKIEDINKWRQNLKKIGKSVVLVGGCFDVLHPGHVIFLEKAKKTADSLVILLESDQKIRQLKGVNRPVHNLRQRAKILSSLRSVDYVVMLPYIDNEKSYDQLVAQIEPDIIAVTYGDNNAHHQRSAKLIGAKLKYVTKMIGNHSTSRILDK